MRPGAARCRFQWPYFTLTSGRADTGLTLVASFVCCGNGSGLVDSQAAGAAAATAAAAAAACFLISLQTGTLTPGTAGTFRATRRGAADDLKPDRLSPSR